MEYEVKKSLPLGKPVVHYECARCKASLSAPLSDAGSSEKCPTCQAPHLIPGVDEKRAEDEKRQQKEIEASHRKRDKEDVRRRAIESNRVNPADPAWRHDFFTRDLLAPVKLAMKIRSDARRKSTAQIPKYKALGVCAEILQLTAAIVIVSGVVALMIVNADAEQIRFVESALIVVSSFVVAVFYLALAQLLEAIRDMAINSWHQRAASSAMLERSDVELQETTQ